MKVLAHELTEWITFKEKNKIKDQIDKVFDLVGFTSSLQKFPDELSGGEQQRVAIARSMLNEPELIIADEPTGNLDPELSRDIMSLFAAFNAIGVTVLVATHDLSLIATMNQRIITLQKGQLLTKEQAHEIA